MEISTIFANTEDYRVVGRCTHSLSDILGLSLCGIIADCDDFTEIEDYGKDNIIFLQQALNFSFAGGIPSLDTMERMFKHLDTKELQTCFSSFLGNLQASNQHLAIDGKELRSTIPKGKKHSLVRMVNVWATDLDISFAQYQVDKKSNEITAIPALLDMITCENSVITINAKIAKQTANYLISKAITNEQLEHCLTQGAQIVADIHAKGCNVIGFGEMGIANTSSAAILMSICCKSLIENCVGKGTGLSNEQLENKIQVLRKAILHHNLDNETATLEEMLMAFGGFEIAMMCGAMLKAAELKMVVLVDGFIATSAFLVAHHKEPLVKEYAIFTHQSDEQGHKKMLDFLKVKPILNLNMRLGEGMGCAMAYPIVSAAANFLTEMASFGSAGVSEK